MVYSVLASCNACLSVKVLGDKSNCTVPLCYASRSSGVAFGEGLERDGDHMTKNPKKRRERGVPACPEHEEKKVLSNKKKTFLRTFVYVP
jgi:hypothetical protein